MSEREVTIQAADVSFSLRNLQRGSIVSSAKHSGEIIVNG